MQHIVPGTLVLAALSLSLSTPAQAFSGFLGASSAKLFDKAGKEVRVSAQRSARGADSRAYVYNYTQTPADSLKGSSVALCGADSRAYTHTRTQVPADFLKGSSVALYFAGQWCPMVINTEAL
jgi:hypothetical protein